MRRTRTLKLRKRQCFVSVLVFIALSTFHLRTSHSFSEQEIYNAIAQGQPYQKDGQRASFIKDGTKWTIVGAGAPIVSPTITPGEWPVKGNDFEIVVIDEPITNEKILPWTEPITNAIKSDKISIQGCPGEYEPASFVIQSGDIDLRDITIALSDLEQHPTEEEPRSQVPIIPKENVDVRVVKCWYQAGKDLHLQKGISKTLTSELLLKDDSIIQVNHEYQVNVVKDLEGVSDSRDLRPFNVSKRENKQIWITVSIPGSAKTGTYTGKLVVYPKNLSSKTLDLEINVLPFSLDDPLLIYSMFYNADLPKAGEAVTASGRARTVEKMFLELRDMKRHGITNPTIDQRQWRPDVLEKILYLRKEAGFSNETIFYTAWPGLHPNEEYLSRVRQHCKNAVQLLKGKGASEVFFYGFDELDENRYSEAVPIYRDFKKSGASTFVAGKNGFFTRFGNGLDLPIIWGQGGGAEDGSLNEAVKLAHSMNKKVWIYSFPQCGVEEPETYRRNYGLRLWKLGFDGECAFTYQGAMNNIWDDFDHASFRDEAMTYPTTDGIIPTIQWEGWREGVKDVRYLTTLLKCKDNLSDPQCKLEIEREIAEIEVYGNLNEVRSKVIENILQCKQKKPLSSPQRFTIN